MAGFLDRPPSASVASASSSISQRLAALVLFVFVSVLDGACAFIEEPAGFVCPRFYFIFLFPVLSKLRGFFFFVFCLDALSTPVGFYKQSPRPVADDLIVATRRETDGLVTILSLPNPLLLVLAYLPLLFASVLP